jgi:hypothetical protein
MSPTYWTASLIKDAARWYGWEILPVGHPHLPTGTWGARKDRCRVALREDRRGGLTGVWLTYPRHGGSNCDHYGPRTANKVGIVLSFMSGIYEQQKALMVAVEDHCRGRVARRRKPSESNSL